MSLTKIHFRVNEYLQLPEAPRLRDVGGHGHGPRVPFLGKDSSVRSQLLVLSSDVRFRVVGTWCAVGLTPPITTPSLFQSTRS